MTASILAPVVPPLAAHGGGGPVRDRRPLPLPQVPVADHGSLTCGTAAVDRDGRIADAMVIGAMGWPRGTRLDFRVSRGLVLVRTDPQAVFRVTRAGQVRLPAPVRHWCGLTGGSRVLLVAYPKDGLLVVQPPAVLRAMVAEFHAGVVGGDVA